MNLTDTVYAIALGQNDKEVKSLLAEGYAQATANELGYSAHSVWQLRQIAQACRVVAGALEEEACQMAEALVTEETHD